jgi:ketosteroid isomerase-like protein
MRKATFTIAVPLICGTVAAEPQQSVTVVHLVKGVKLESYSIEQLALHVTGDVAINYYRIKLNWVTSEGVEVRKEAFRITHTWSRTHGTWQILGGMSAPVNAEGK